MTRHHPARHRAGAARAGGRAIGRGEFIGLMAMLSAMTAFGIDAMLPALPLIGADLSPADPNRAQLVITAFVFGMGLGTFATGPLSDALGRRPVIAWGVALYVLGAVVSFVASSLWPMLAGRVLMGLGAAGPRVAVMAIVRDRYRGAEMARLMSFVAVIFMVVPAIAPSIGALVMGAAGWRAIFPFFALFGGAVLGWFLLRQPETLAPADRRPVRPAMLRAALAEMFALPVIRLSILLQTLVFAMLFAMLSSIQGIFETAYDEGARFPLWFALIATVSASASLLNARLVMRIGMLRIVRGMFALQIALSAGMLAALALPLPREVEFAVWLAWSASVFLQTSLTMGNINALSMEPVGHIAGIAASVIAALSTVGSVLIAVPVGLASDGTAQAIALGVLVLATLAWLLARRLPAG
ncbi:MAG: MFS transporter [Rubellimicrobium sp.]|nr:MFS transporter [Rubellimicrobium sp.]